MVAVMPSTSTVTGAETAVVATPSASPAASSVTVGSDSTIGRTIGAVHTR